MAIPVLRKTITLANLSTTTIPVRSIVPLNERRVDLPATSRLFQSRLHLLLRPEHRPIVDLFDPPLHSSLMHRCIDQILRRTVTRLLGSSTFACTTRHSLLTKRLKNCLFIWLILITRDQSRWLVFQASRRILYQPFCILFRSLAIDHCKHEFVFGIQGNVIPVVATACIIRIVCVAVFLFFSYKVPFLVELYLFGLRGKKPRVRREVVRHVRLQVWYND